MDIPTTIKAQLLASGLVKVMSWGAHKWTETARNELSFKVCARRFHGIISIVLNEAHDEYEIYYYDNKSLSAHFINNRKPSSQFEPILGVCWDQLVDCIDVDIEK